VLIVLSVIQLLYLPGEVDMFEWLKEAMHRYFGTDPAEHWPVRKPARLEFDLETCALNGIAFGDRFERLELFGKPDNARPVYYQLFKYIGHGMVVEIENGLIDYISFIFADEIDDEFRSPTVRFRSDAAKAAEMSKATMKSDVIDFFGEPEMIDADEFEILLVYEIGALKLEFELNLSEGLKRLNVFPKDAIH